MPNDDVLSQNVHRGPLEAAASELGERYRVTTRAPLPVAVWAHIGAVRAWLKHASSVCANPPSDLSKAAEWLLDNDFQIKRTLGQIEKDLPPKFYLSPWPMDFSAHLISSYLLREQFVSSGHTKNTRLSRSPSCGRFRRCCA
jgi:hypothetical protein